MNISSLNGRVWSSRRRLGLVLAISLLGQALPFPSQAESATLTIVPTDRGTIGGAATPNEEHAPAARQRWTEKGGHGLAQDLGKRALLSLERFASERHAVEAAVARFNPHSIREDREYLGAIIALPNADESDDDRPVYRYLVARGKPGQDRVRIQLPMPKGAEIVAFWHTHGAHGPHRHLFSGSDTRLVRKTGKPFYLADANGDLRVYRPGHKLLSAGLRHRMGLTAGHGYAEGELLMYATDPADA